METVFYSRSWTQFLIKQNRKGSNKNFKRNISQGKDFHYLTEPMKKLMWWKEASMLPKAKSPYVFSYNQDSRWEKKFSCS